MFRLVKIEWPHGDDKTRRQNISSFGQWIDKKAMTYGPLQPHQSQNTFWTLRGLVSPLPTLLPMSSKPLWAPVLKHLVYNCSGGHHSLQLCHSITFEPTRNKIEFPTKQCKCFCDWSFNDSPCLFSDDPHSLWNHHHPLQSVLTPLD